MVGQTLNHYKIVSQLGRGGMGEVYVAEDTRLDRRVALKVLPPEMALDAERRARFEREAKTVASLNHPNIVTVFSVEQAGETHFITMELVEGRTLTEILGGSRLPTGKLLDYAVELTEAVTGAHRKGITHRDLKPDNVMLDADGRIKVLDFGLARVGEAPGQPSGPALPTQTVTQEGKILGTVAYMAPEQAEGRAVDARSDIFSLGVLLYEMATGKRPFAGDTSISTITSILRDTPRSITDLNESLPRHLGRIVKRCLEKDPERRYQTAQDLRNDLQGLREELQSGELSATDVAVAASGSATSGKNWPAIALGFVALAAIAVAAVLFLGRQPGQSPHPAAASEAAMEITPLTVTGNSSEATISSDGRYVAYVLRDESGRKKSLWVTQVSTGSKVQIVEPTEDNLWDPAFSPDGDFVYYCRYREPEPSTLERVPTLGGAPRKVLSDVQGRVSFAPDGQRFVFLRSNAVRGSIVVVGVDGSNETTLAALESPRGFNDPTWSPDGTVIAAGIMNFTDKGPEAGVAAMPSDGGEPRTFAEMGLFGVGEMSWLPDGSGLILNRETLTGNELWEVAYPSGDQRRVVTDLNNYHGAQLTADGRTLVTQQSESVMNVWTLEMEPGAEAVRITSSRRGDYNDIRWKPDGRLSYTSSAGGTIGVWSMTADGTDALRITPEDSLNADAVWTPDGKTMVFLSTRAGTINVWRAGANGGNPERLTYGTIDVSPTITPDGRNVVYQEITTLGLMQVPVEGGDAVPFLEGRFNRAPFFSPDGTRVLVLGFNEDENDFKFEIRRLPGGELLRTVEVKDAGDFKWAPDGEALTFIRKEGNVGNLWRLPLDGGKEQSITRFDDELLENYAWSPDGKRLVMVRGTRTTDLVLLKNFR